MKIKLQHIGYIAGLLERRGHIPELEYAERSIEFQFNNEITAKYVAQILNVRVRQWKSRKNSYMVFLPTKLAMQWFMTCWPLVSPIIRDRITQAILTWRAKQMYRNSKKPTCHPERKYHAKGLCVRCYSRKRHSVAYYNIRIKDI